MSQVFISYSRKDIEFVDRLANDLTNAGFEVWYDLSGLEAGSQWGNEIQKAIDTSQYFLVVLSQNSVQSNWVEREFLRASDQGLKIIPILYQKCRLPLWSLNLHFIDMQGRNYSRKYQELLKLMGVQSTLSEDNPIALNYIKIGDEYRKIGQPDQAIASYLQALNVDPNSLKAQYNIGAIHLEEQAFKEAAAAFKLALQISGDDLLAKAGFCDACMSLGNQARADGEIEEAIGLYNEILKVSPDDDNARRSLANIFKTKSEDLLAAGQEEKALDALKDALAYTPHDKSLTAFHKKLQDQIKARQLNVLFTRSDEELAVKNWEKAIEALNEALEIAPQDASIVEKIESIQEQRQEEKLKSILLKVEQAEETERWDTAIAGLNEYLQIKRDDKVIQKRMAELMASKRSSWLNAINLRLEQAVGSRKWEEALAVLNEALEVEPDNKELRAREAQVIKDRKTAELNAFILRAEQAASVGRWDDAIQILNNGLIENPGEQTLKSKLAEVHQAKREEKLKSVLNLADMAARAEKWETAVSSLNEILASEPDNPVFLEKFDEILRLERASKLKELQTRARNLVKAEKFDEALAAWNEQLALQPENRQAVLDEIEAVNKAQKLADLYARGMDSLANKEYVRAVDFFKRIEVEDTKYKDTARQLAKAERRLGDAGKSPHSQRRKYWLIGTALLVVVLVTGTMIFWPRDNKSKADTQSNALAALSRFTNTPAATLTHTPTQTRTPDPVILAALTTIQNEEPLYQTRFDDWDTEDTGRNAALVNGKLILTSEGEDEASLFLNQYPTDSYVLEFEVSILEYTSANSHCVYEAMNEAMTKVQSGKESWRTFSMEFHPGEDLAVLSVNDPESQLQPRIATASFDKSKSNIIRLIVVKDQITAFINGQLAYTAQNPHGSAVYFSNQLSAYNGITCEFENYMIWDLSEADYSASTGTITTGPISFFGSALNSIADKTPDYEDDFSNPASGWPTDQNSRGETGYKDGEYLISSENDCNSSYPPTNRLFSDFVVEMDVRFINQGEGHASIYFRDNPFAHYGANLLPSGWFNFHKNVNGIHIELLGTKVPESTFQAWDTPKHLTLIARQDRMAFYVNGNLVIALSDTSSREGTFNFGVCSSTPLHALIDNLKIWDISGMSSFNPSPKVSETPSPSPEITETPLSDWVTDFAEPIISIIDEHHANASSNFDQYPHWLKVTDCPEFKVPKAVDGELIWDQFCPLKLDRWYTDFVIDMQVRHLNPSSEENDRFTFTFRNGGGTCDFSTNGEVRCNGMLHPLLVNHTAQWPTDPYRIRFIVQESEYALFINDQPFYHGSLPSGYKSGEIGWWPGGVAFDDMTIWDLNNLIKP